MESRIIKKTLAFILNARALGFEAGGWPDIQAYTGQLSQVDKKELVDALIAAGAIYRGQFWNFGQLDIDTLRATPVFSPDTEKIKLVSIISKVEAGTWGRDINGRIRFVKDPNYHFGIDINEEDCDQDDDGPDESSYFDDPRKGKLDLDL